jgi:hypothetical protein
VTDVLQTHDERGPRFKREGDPPLGYRRAPEPTVTVHTLVNNHTLLCEACELRPAAFDVETGKLHFKTCMNCAIPLVEKLDHEIDEC